jgi:hypothetical protein
MTPHHTPVPTESLEPTISNVEARLGELSHAMAERDSRGIENAASDLQRALASALDSFSRAARSGGVPPLLRRRLVRASGQVAAQRETLARATASLDRALEGLIPREAMVYDARGTASLSAHSGSLRA